MIQFIIFRCDISRGEAEHARQSRSKASSSCTCFLDAEPPPKKGVPPPPKKGVPPPPKKGVPPPPKKGVPPIN